MPVQRRPNGPNEVLHQVLAAHKPEIDWAYEEFNCSCGWKEPTALGVRRVKDGTRSWPAHQRRALLLALDHAS